MIAMSFVQSITKINYIHRETSGKCDLFLFIAIEGNVSSNVLKNLNFELSDIFS